MGVQCSPSAASPEQGRRSTGPQRLPSSLAIIEWRSASPAQVAELMQDAVLRPVARHRTSLLPNCLWPTAAGLAAALAPEAHRPVTCTPQRADPRLEQTQLISCTTARSA